MFIIHSCVCLHIAHMAPCLVFCSRRTNIIAASLHLALPFREMLAYLLRQVIHQMTCGVNLKQWALQDV